MHGCKGGHAWLQGACVGYDEIRSMSGRYASCWNAFLFTLTRHFKNLIKFIRLEFSKVNDFYFDEETSAPNYIVIPVL